MYFEGILDTLRNLGTFFKQAWFSGKPRWTPAQMTDLAGKVVIVTGGSSGIGKEIVKELLLHNAKVYLAARNPEKTANVIKELTEATGRTAIFLDLDLGDLKSVKAAAEKFLSNEKSLDILFNNGGVMLVPQDMLTVQGYDYHFGVNVLGHFYLTKLLLPALLSTEGKARVVTTSSSAIYLPLGSKILFETLKDGPSRKRKSPSYLYSQSKVCDAMFALELARRYGDKGIVSISLNPGNLKTNLDRHASWFNSIGLWFLLLWPATWGAWTSLWAGTSPENEDANGKFMVPWCQEGAMTKTSRDLEVGERLWAWMEDQVKDV
ncbi:NAD(P)-binding protein [Guyanagaster necrorhizus]|uniref:NAD(P)-binding protein n=1 Tax=Guyanagaster necrorhizus TaxID=856835 RepID=A0A9P7VYJ4_9AGAR|nr:NAD(P)-binding protein [Guyanagaster necrorhizus MCA 3950]KAG7449941.1 NAD(P)-binding protein [Guyanagaster necrorhizus MCA 3950]